ncbi:MAG TPA: YbdK family carboxylate-amine ligase [Deltaproteobacteria bacterium]|nr:YbdK family carboxylate-amine ligase [Deltaproteobacteria bacterium]
MAVIFKTSREFTVGIEVEAQLVDGSDMSLVPASTAIIDALGSSRFGDSIKHELMLSNIEVVTSVCADVAEAERDLREKFGAVVAEAARRSTLVCCAGTHPFSPWRDQQVTAKPRYRRLLDDLQYVARRFNIFGLHVHIGVGGGEKCVYVMNRLVEHLPKLLALSANSPFWEGEFTGLMSYRTKVFETLPIAGLPFYFDDWRDYVDIIEKYKATGTIRSFRDIWWDVRPHPDFGTIEARVCDVPSTLGEICAVAALIQALVVRFSRDFDAGVPCERTHPAIIRENKWRACRYGLDALLIDAGGVGTDSASDSVLRLLDMLRREMDELGTLGYADRVRAAVAAGGGAMRQLARWRESGELASVVEELVDLLRGELE